MYAWVWRHLPGPWPAKLVVALVLIAAVVALLFTVVFPWVEPRLPFGDVTVGDEQSGALRPLAAVLRAATGRMLA